MNLHYTAANFSFKKLKFSTWAIVCKRTTAFILWEEAKHWEV